MRRVHHVYLVRCADGTLYTGYALDPRAREQVHNSGRGAHYTACRRPVTLVHAEAFATRSEALKREYELKRWTRARKEALVAAASRAPAPAPAARRPRRGSRAPSPPGAPA